MLKEPKSKDPSQVSDSLGSASKRGAGMHVWTAASDVTVQRVPPLKKMRQIASAAIPGSFTMVCASPTLPGHTASFTFRRQGEEVKGSGPILMHARFEPPFPTKLGAPITEMTATLDGKQPVQTEILKLVGQVEYQLEDGETITDHALTVSLEKSDLEKLLVKCANTARQDWYVLVIYN